LRKEVVNPETDMKRLAEEIIRIKKEFIALENVIIFEFLY